MKTWFKLLGEARAHLAAKAEIPVVPAAVAAVEELTITTVVAQQDQLLKAIRVGVLVTATLVAQVKTIIRLLLVGVAALVA